jgi:hypothetical protein
VLRQGDSESNAALAVACSVEVIIDHRGVELAPLAGHLHALPDVATWSVRLRRSIVSLDEQDEAKVRKQLDPMLIPLDQAIEGYLNACRVPDPAR